MRHPQGLRAASLSAERIYVEDVFQTWLYTGNSSTQTITNGIDLSGKGGLVWFKQRNSGSSHELVDTARGVGYGLDTRLTGAQTTLTDLTSFTSTGFSLEYNTGNANFNTGTFASWTFRKAAKFFDVVTYTGDGSNRTIAHNLGSVPGCIIVKRTDTTGNWQVYHRANTANPETDYLVLNSTAATADSDTRWNDTLPTSTVFSLGIEATVNANTGTYVAYLFAHDAGGFGDSGNDSVVSCGSFTTDGSGNATVNLGWEPQFVIAKLSSTTSDWFTFDSMRGFIVAASGSRVLSPNQTYAEYAQGASFAPTSTGFTIGGGFGVSQAGIYIAIRRGPMKTPTDATTVFSPLTLNTTTGTKLTTGFPVDMQIAAIRTLTDSTTNNVVHDRVRGVSTNTSEILRSLNTASTAVELIGPSGTQTRFWDNTGFQFPSFITGYSSTFLNFRRAPGFFDVVAYTGGGFVNESIPHNLGVKPELVIIKRRTASELWWVNALFGASSFQLGSLNYTDQFSATTYSVQGFGNPTSSALVFNSIGSGGHASGATYIAYLFASCPGVSKVGSYTGTGTTLSIDCGFTAGARFVLIKRTDSIGDWYVWDTARGIISGNDPYLLLNSTAAEVTNTDYIDPLSTGFQISSTAPAAINNSGGSFIFLAIA